MGNSFETCHGPPTEMGEPIGSVKKPASITVWGDEIDRDTRVILTLLNLSGVQYKFIHKTEDEQNFEELNPSKQIPMILLSNDIKLLAGIRE